jgi:hypothetical protein
VTEIDAMRSYDRYLHILRNTVGDVQVREWLRMIQDLRIPSLPYSRHEMLLRYFHSAWTAGRVRESVLRQRAERLEREESTFYDGMPPEPAQLPLW